MNEIHLQTIIAQATNNEKKEITPESNNKNTKGWDSLAHVDLIIRLEEETNNTFTAEEAAKLTSVESITEILTQKRFTVLFD